MKRKVIMKCRQMIAFILSFIMLMTALWWDTSNVTAESNNLTIYFVDGTNEGWIANDSAVIELVDNTQGHDKYEMKKIGDKTWSVTVPSSAYNITFNRYDSSKNNLWNSWSAGGRDGKVTYEAKSASHGAWKEETSHDQTDDVYFQEGDIIYLDISSFKNWQEDDALFYVNGTDATKTENGGNNIIIKDADEKYYFISNFIAQETKYVYSFEVLEEFAGKSVLRFWRGNDSTLWNYSICISAEDYAAGNNCIKVEGWNEKGFLTNYQVIDEEELSYADMILKYYSLDSDPKGDEDGDGVPNMDEVSFLGTNPTVKDTDENGINDGDEDDDDDGLTNSEEVRLQTEPEQEDTDLDGLEDYEEIKKYHTDPKKEDTDRDGLSDYAETILETDPIKLSSDGVIADSERYFTQVLPEYNINVDDAPNSLMPSLTCNAKGYIGDNIYIEPGTALVCLSNRSIIGEPIEILDYKEDNTKSYRLSFDVKNLKNTGRYPDKDMYKLMICKLGGYDATMDLECDDILSDMEEEEALTYDEGAVLELNEYCFEPFKTTYDKENHSIQAEVNGSGIYMVMNAEDFLYSLGIKVFENVENTSLPVLSKKSVDNSPVSPQIADFTGLPDEITTPGQADIVFVIDSSYEMNSNIQNVKDNINEFAAKLVQDGIGVNFAIVEYGDDFNNTKVHKNGFSNWYVNPKDFTDEVNKIKVSDINSDTDSKGTCLVDAMSKAEQLDYRNDADKFIIIVTNSGYQIANEDNIQSLEEISYILMDENICTSIITDSSLEETYSCITEGGNGLYGEINKNFSEVLLDLSILVNRVVHSGYWYLIDSYDYVKLDKPYSKLEDQDTDGDGISDYEELGNYHVVDYSYMINQLLDTYVVSHSLAGVGTLIFSGNPYVMEFSTCGNPSNIDSDGDGILDNKDINPNISVQDMYFYHDNVKMQTSVTDLIKTKINTQYEENYDFRLNDFFLDNKTFNKRLCKVSCIMSGMAYNKNESDGDPADAADDEYLMQYMKKARTISGNIKKKKVKNKMDIKEVLSMHGFEEVKAITVGKTDNHRTKCYFGVRKIVSGNRERCLVAVVVKGTNGTAEEWSSNFEFGTGINGGVDKNSDWKNISNHKGFDIAATRVKKELDNYVAQYSQKYVGSNKIVYWIMGHSRGAAIANILAANLIDENKITYAYTFASPNTTNSKSRNNEKYKSIFNIVNEDDFVPILPCSDWGFGRYGRSAEIDFDSGMRQTWEKRIKDSLYIS